MSVTVAAFYADQAGQPPRVQEYLPLIEASRKAVELTNPRARYVVLTDRMTAPQIEPHAEVWAVPSVAPDLPLMLKIIVSQALFAERCQSDLLCLPDVDCLVNRVLDDATPVDVGLAITHKGPKFHYKINNLALARDMDLAAWFLRRAFDILAGWSEDKQVWGGDQEAWQCALGVPMPGEAPGPGYWCVVERLRDEILIARPERRTIHLYPCATHNCPLADDGSIRDAQRNAYFVHLKGPRKQHLARFMAERFGT